MQLLLSSPTRHNRGRLILILVASFQSKVNSEGKADGFSENQPLSCVQPEVANAQMNRLYRSLRKRSSQNCVRMISLYHFAI